MLLVNSLLAILPSPSGLHDIFEAITGLPTEQASGLLIVGIDGDDIASAARADTVRHGLASDILERVDSFEDAHALPDTDVEHLASGLASGEAVEIFEAESMRMGQVHDVYIVADATAVAGGVVAPENRKLSAQASRSLRENGHHVVSARLRVLADEVARVRASGIEVAKQDDAEVGVGFGCVAKNLFADLFGSGVGAFGGGQRRIFSHRQGFGIAINRARG